MKKTEEELDKEVLKALPPFPHTADGKKLTEKQMRDLAKLIKESMQKDLSAP